MDPATMMMLAQMGVQVGSSLYGMSQADKEAEEAQRAAYGASGVQQDYLRAAGNVYQQGIGGAGDLVRQYGDRAVAEQQKWGERGLGYLEPTIGAGDVATDHLSAFMTPGGQEDLRGVYEASPSYDILQDVLDEEGRRTMGQYAGQGLGHSGAVSEELARRLSGARLGDYRDWLGRYLNTGTGLAGRGAGAAGQASGLASNVGRGVANTYSNMGTNLANLRMGGADYMGRLLAQQGTLQAAPMVAGQLAGAQAGRAGRDYMSSIAGTLGEADLSQLFRRSPTPTAPTTGWDPYVMAG